MATVGTIGFSNLTLQHSSIGSDPTSRSHHKPERTLSLLVLSGFYQLSKLAVIPSVMLIEVTWHQKTYNSKAFSLHLNCDRRNANKHDVTHK